MGSSEDTIHGGDVTRTFPTHTTTTIYLTGDSFISNSRELDGEVRIYRVAVPISVLAPHPSSGKLVNGRIVGVMDAWRHCHVQFDDNLSSNLSFPYLQKLNPNIRFDSKLVMRRALLKAACVSLLGGGLCAAASPFYDGQRTDRLYNEYRAAETRGDHETFQKKHREWEKAHDDINPNIVKRAGIGAVVFNVIAKCISILWENAYTRECRKRYGDERKHAPNP